MMKRAILSVSDKTGIVELARRLVNQGVTLLSTGGTMMQSVIGVPTAIVDIIRGMIIIFAVAGMAMVKLPKVKAFLSSLGSKNKKAEVTA